MSLIKVRSNGSTVANSPFENLFNDFFEGEFMPARRFSRSSSAPAANIQETDKAYHVELASPGMAKKDFKIEVDEDLLTIRSEKESEKEDENTRFTKREFNYTSFVRSFHLPEEVDADKISASYTDGILSLEIPKKVVVAKKVKSIDIK